ncbi:hypothetical protein V1511DRAFT_494451 [Dipodascopsis uninucleata]
MSRASKITLGVVSTVAAITVYGVHYIQEQEEKTMYEGVLKDIERQKVKRAREEDFLLNQRLQREYEAIQPLAERPKS